MRKHFEDGNIFRALHSLSTIFWTQLRKDLPSGSVPSGDDIPIFRISAAYTFIKDELWPSSGDKRVSGPGKIIFLIEPKNQ